MKKVSDILARKGGNVIAIDAGTSVLDALRLISQKKTLARLLLQRTENTLDC